MLPKLLRRKSLLLHFSLELAGVVGASSLARLGAALCSNARWLRCLWMPSPVCARLVPPGSVSTKRKVTLVEGQGMEQTAASYLFALFCSTSSQRPTLPHEVQPHVPPPSSSTPRENFRLPRPLLLGFICLEYELLVCLQGRVVRRPLVRLYDCRDEFYYRWLDQNQQSYQADKKN